MERDLDLYKITIDDLYSDGKTDLGWEATAYVKSPAIQLKGMAFNADQVKTLYFNDNVKMRIAAPALVPMQIYRYDQEEDYEYYVEFTAEVIEQLYSKFMKNLSNQGKFNLEHDSTKIAPAYILESILVDSDIKIKMIKDEYNIVVPKGSVFLVSQVTDKDYYNQLVKEERFAYSIEGFLGMEYVKEKLSEMKNKNKFKDMKKIYSNIERQHFTIISETSKWDLNVDNTTFNLGDKITYTYDGISCKISDGEYELADGRKIFVDAEGIIVLIKEATQLNKNKEKTKMEENLMLPDGEQTIGEKIYVIKDGKVIEIKDVIKAEDAPVTDAPIVEEKVEAADTTSVEAPVPVDAPVVTDTPTMDEDAILAIIQPKLDEIYAMIAELKAKTIEEEVIEGVQPEAVQMSISQKLAEFNKFNQ